MVKIELSVKITIFSIFILLHILRLTAYKSVFLLVVLSFSFITTLDSIHHSTTLSQGTISSTTNKNGQQQIQDGGEKDFLRHLGSAVIRLFHTVCLCPRSDQVNYPVVIESSGQTVSNSVSNPFRLVSWFL